ncbi:MAG: choline monooxygenase [Blastocatellia bacterium]|jgi:choline monooxygenase|nr:choline monooxygenase [Blastocatellia bacterium]
MEDSLQAIIDSYDPSAPLAQASTIPSSWYTDQRVFELEQQTVFSSSWQVAARLDQLRDPGNYVTTDIAGEPIVIARGSDGELRGFFNVCRHHAAAVMTEPAGHATQMRCPYHGWTYSLEGQLKGTPDFTGVCNFDRTANGLAPVEIATWEQWVFVRLNEKQNPSLNRPSPSLPEFLGSDIISQIKNLGLEKVHWIERRRYTLKCNWKVFVDNYLDGGYHVPHLHKGLDSVLDYSRYTIENGERFCLQSSPIVSPETSNEIGAVRSGKSALYYWLYPNFMLNYYEGVLDTNLVRPLALDRTEVVFDFHFADVSDAARARNLASIDVGDRIQREDLDICESVQRGLNSRAYNAGRLSVRREAGEHLFHRLLHEDLKSGSGRV